MTTLVGAFEEDKRFDFELNKQTVRPQLRTVPMYKAYFVRRLLETLSLADHADDEQQKLIYLQASRYYRDLIQLLSRRN